MAFVEYKGEILPYSFEDKAIDKVLELEGGYNPKDPVTGMPVNKGIDQRANPEIDVSKLSKEDAKKIYREKYWKASGADELPEKLALVHFDATVNQGPEKAKQLLEASGGDVSKYLELRKADYQRLAEQNPQKYGSSLKGWMNRLDSIAADVTPSFEEYEGEIIPIGKTKADIEKSREQGFKDIGKTIAAPIISGLASIPEATETMLRGATRNRLGPTGIILNKLLGAPVVPENVYPEAKIEALKDLSKKGEEVAEAIRESRSEETKKIIGESKIEGDLFDPSSWSIGEKPSTAGIAYQALEAISSTVPIIATALITKSPTVATGIGGTMGAGDAIRTTREYISKMSDTELAEKSPEFARLSEEVGPKKAREIILTKASEDASVAAGLIASIGGNITANLVTGKFDDLLLKSIKNRAGRIALGTAGGMTEEGLQELVEGIATDLGIDQYVARKIGTDSFANLVLGALGGAGPGGVRGAVAKPSKEEISKDFVEVSDDVEIVPIRERKEPTLGGLAPEDIATPEEVEKAQAAPEIDITGTGVTPSQDVEYSLAELEGRLPVVEEPVAEEVKAEAPIEETPVEEEIVEEPAISEITPEDAKEIKILEQQAKKISSAPTELGKFLQRQGIQPSEKSDLGLEKGKKGNRPSIFRGAAPSFDELTSRAIDQGFLTPSGDDVQDVNNFREYVSEFLTSGIVSTGPDATRAGELNDIQDQINSIKNKYEKPSFGLEETTPEQLRAADEKRKTTEAEAARIEAEDQAKRDREEIARLSQSSEFALGKTAAEDLTGQKSVFEQEDVDTEMARKAEEGRAEIERRKAVGDEDADIPFFSPLVKEFNKTNEDIREEKIRELQGLAQRKAAADRRFVKDKSKKGDMFNFKVLSEQIDILSQEIDDLKEEDRRPEAWLKRAGDAIADKKDPISQEVYDVIQAVYKKNPKLLDGLKLSITKLPEGKSATGEFKPYSRLVYLYKDTSGIEDPSTIRHELTHTLEQMMPKEAKKALIARWNSEFKRAYLAEKTDAGKKFFQKVVEMLENPSTEAFNKAVEAIPTLPDGSQDYRYYQFISPSEYWAVNAEPLMQAYLGTGWQRFKNGVKALFEALKNVFGIRNNSIFYNTFNQVINGPRLNNMMLNHYVSTSIPALNIHRNYLGGQPPLATWDSPEESKMLGVNKSDLIYKLQDKFVDLKDVEKAIRDTSGEIDERFDAYMKEELYHGRTAERVRDFLREDLLPIIKKLREKGLNIGQFEEYLHNRHAEERNEQIARVNEDMPDGGSGIMTKDAKAYLAALDPKERATLESVAKDIDQMVKETQDILLDNGLEDAKTINTWRKTYKNYVPLQRDLDIAGGTVSLGGKGYGTRGKESKRATGSEKAVVDILANLAIQRERAIMKAEKARVGRALYGLALKNPNPGFWLPVNPDAIKDPKALAKELQFLGLNAEDAMNFIKEPVTKVIKDGVVTYAPNINQRFADNVFPIRVNGQDRFIFFNTKDPRAVRLITSLKNIDAQQLAGAIGMTAKVTRFIASMNTQYNPVFGAWNFTRDVGAAMLNLSTTQIADKKAQVLAGTFPALRAIYSDLRAERKEKTKSDKEWSKLFEQFKRAGGQTGYRDQFSKTEKKGDVIQREMEYLDRGNVKKTVDAIAGWLSDYNDAMENAVRLSAFKAALDKGLSEDKAASIAKNLTVNFNRKGTWSTGIGALYAFFNASVQGTARLAETLKGPAGKKIMAGGLLLGTFQALALAMYGFDDDEPPEFLKDKNLIIPNFIDGDGKYLIIPMPLGFNAIPATGRRITELVLSGGKDAPGKIIDLFGVWVDAFNPIGNGSFAQMLTPTAADPFVSVSMNKDTFGRPISKEDRGTSPTPGFMRSSDRSSEISKYISEFLNDISSPPGTSYVKGRISPTADELDYIAGQFLGGVGREAKKAAETVTSVITGEEIEPSRRFVIGKVLGDKESNQAVRSKFYKNVKDMADFESEIKGRKDAKDDTLQEFKDENPESRLWKRANDVENRISEINQKITKFKAKKEDEEYYKERVKDLEDRKIEIMRNFNERVKEEKESQ
jgi:hypothetical protein